jgi:hypothetical protein
MEPNPPLPPISKKNDLRSFFCQNSSVEKSIRSIVVGSFVIIGISNNVL